MKQMFNRYQQSKNLEYVELYSIDNHNAHIILKFRNIKNHQWNDILLFLIDRGYLTHVDIDVTDRTNNSL